MQHDMPQSLLVLPNPIRRRRLVLGRSVELRIPPENFFIIFLILLFTYVYAHI